MRETETMGKIVKYCSSCDEGFAEKFGFCPDCGAALQAFELNPVAEPTPDAAPVAVAASVESPAVVEPPVELVIDETPEIELELEAPTEPVVETTPEPAIEKTTYVPPAPVYASTKALDADRIPTDFEAERDAWISDGGFYVTVIQEKNVKQRNTLLVGTLGFMIVVLMSGVVYSIFSKDLDIGAINDDIFSAVLTDLEPMTVDEQQKKDKDDGGGGGGGKNEKDPASQGDLADQSKTPTRPPDVNTMKSDTPMLQTPTTEGTMKFPKIYGKWGDPNGTPGLSNGQGTGGGIGSGRGTGQGSGNGTGTGSGDGSGFGSGRGNGNGSGTGDGDGLEPPPVGVTQALKILAKPKPSYTDAARQNQVQGTVILRVTFLASGGIGSISSVKGLPNGLTEQAIAAARSIRFEPAKRGGIGQTVTKQVEYTFSIY